jgi:hypothetical protein
VPQTGGGDVETHTEQPEAPVPIIARPPCPQPFSCSNVIPGPPSLIQTSPSRGLLFRLGSDTHTRGLLHPVTLPEELVERVIHQLRDTLPRSKLNITKDAQQARVRLHVDKAEDL